MRILLLFVLMIAFCSACFSQMSKDEIKQKIQCISGYNLNIKFEFDDSLIVGSLPEKEFIDEEVQHREAKDPGTGEEIRTKWEDDKKKRFPVRFITLINKHLESKEVKVVQDSTVKYTIIVKAKNIDPGLKFGAAIGDYAYVDFIISIVETENPSKPIIKIKLNHVGGSTGFSIFSIGMRVAESYAKAGRLLADYILKYAY